MQKVPAVEHEGKVVTECAAICLYLADAFPQADLAPPADARADYYRWILIAAGPREQATMMQALGAEAAPDRSAMAGFGDCQRTLDTLLGAVPERGYVTGAKFTAADVYVGAQLVWGVQFGSIQAIPPLEAYPGRTQSRRGFIRANELDDAAGTEYEALYRKHPRVHEDTDNSEACIAAITADIAGVSAMGVG